MWPACLYSGQVLPKASLLKDCFVSAHTLVALAMVVRADRCSKNLNIFGNRVFL